MPWASLVCAIVVTYSSFWPGVTGDMNYYLLDWYGVIIREGRLGAFAQPFSNYTPPYLYLLAAASGFDGLLGEISIIKLLSVAGVAMLAMSVWYLLDAIGMRDRPRLKAAWVFLIPTVSINAAALGQCDAFWSAACVMAVAETVKGRRSTALLWFGVGIAFKAQAVFLAPFILARLVADRAPLHLWCIPGIVYVAAMLPAWLAGWPALDLATIYLRQTEWGPSFISNAANPWSFVQHLMPETGTNLLWIGHAAAAIGTLVFVVILTRRPLTDTRLVSAALLSAMMLPWLLPKMHERFFFLAEILSFTLALVLRDRIAVLLAFLIQGATLLAYAQLLGGSPWLAPLGSLLNLTAIILILRTLLSDGAIVTDRTGTSRLHRAQSHLEAA